MSTSRALTALLLAAGLSSSGCVRSYAKQPPLSFQDLDYTSESTRQPWPLKRLPLKQQSQQYNLGTIPEVAYVDMPGATPDAKTVIFIHGLGSYLKFWRSQLDAFNQQGYRVIAVDLPGYGKSDKPASFPYTMEAMADVVLELAQTLGIEQPILAGHSMGGQTALSYAIRYPDKLGALVLVAPAGFEKFPWKEKAWFLRAFSTELIKSSPEAAIWGSVRQANFMNWRPELEWLIEERVRVAKSPEFDAYAYANVRTVKGLVNNDFVRDNLHHVTVPTLIVYGTDDRLIPNPFLHGGEPSDIFEYGASRIPGSKLVPLKGCGHTVQLDCPERFNQAVLPFLSAAAQGRIAVPEGTEPQPETDKPGTPTTPTPGMGTPPPSTPGSGPQGIPADGPRP